MAWGKAGTTTLSSSGSNMEITGMTASKFNQILCHVSGTSASTFCETLFNSDTTSSYANRASQNGGTDFTRINSTDLNMFESYSNTTGAFLISYFVNIATEEKLGISFSVREGTTGAGNAPARDENAYKWTNTSAQITSSSFTPQSGTVNTDSNLSVLGSDLTPASAVAKLDSLSNVQTGSRWEETDTRKMYHNVVLTNGTTSENAGWYEEGITTPQYPPTRGVWASGYTNAGGGRLNTIDYATIATAGNATDFGDMIVGRETPAGVSSYTRGVIGGGIDLNSSVTGAITAEYITILTTGNATTFGDLTVCRSGVSAVTNKSRGVWYGGQLNNNNTNTIDYVTIDTTGNATDFGDMYGSVTNKLTTGVNDATRGCFGGGYIGGASNRVDYITIATTGNASVFGTLTRSNYNVGSVSSDTRGVFAGGNGSVNTMDYITIASTGNATDFGDMNVGISGCQGNSDGTRGVFAGGWITNAMEYITIATLGNGTNFGDLTVARDAPAGGLVG